MFRPGVFVLPDILAEDYGSEVLNIWALAGIGHALAFHERYWRSEREEAAQVCERLSVRVDGAVQRIPLDEIEWVEAQGNYVRINAGGGRLMVRETMRNLEQRLGARFLRVHRSAIVNIDSVERVEARSPSEHWLILRSGARVPTGRSYKDRIRSLLQ
jgi:two-component system LytT family response regulator